MKNLEKILSKYPSTKLGLDDHYGKQTVMNLLNDILQKETKRSKRKHKKELEWAFYAGRSKNFDTGITTYLSFTSWYRKHNSGI